MPYPDKLLAEDEEVVRHLHPHWLTLARPVLVLLLVVGGTSFGAALVPAGPSQGRPGLAPPDGWSPRRPLSVAPLTPSGAGRTFGTFVLT